MSERTANIMAAPPPPADRAAQWNTYIGHPLPGCHPPAAAQGTPTDECMHAKGIWYRHMVPLVAPHEPRPS
eukprot:12783608-Prorocentrum_lima.AAC.1